MEEVQNKYRNFIDFMKNNLKNTTYVSLLTSVTLEQFLAKLKEQGDIHPNLITKSIASKCGINLGDFDENTLNKFERYIQYFQKVSKTLY
jgi:hypothetical protein